MNEFRSWQDGLGEYLAARAAEAAKLAASPQGRRRRENEMKILIAGGAGYVGSAWSRSC